MILHPSVLALTVASLVVAGLLLYASRWAVAILRHWDLRSGASLQLELERRTFLVSTILRLVLFFEVVSLFLYVYVSDSLAPLFTGAMCAAGTLHASPYGYPVLVLGLLNFVLASLWLVLNRLDNLAPDYPLVRVKYALLLGLAPLVLVEAGLRVAHFAGLHPEVITSCCGSLFAAEGGGVAGELAGLPGGPAAAALFATAGGALAAALLFRATRRGAWLLAVLAAAAVPAGLAAVIAFVSPYVYELPTHHCPFCLLQREYRFVGYPLYATLMGGGVAGMAVGLVRAFGGRASLTALAPAMERRLATASAALLALFLALVAYLVATSALRM